ncbi:hypothetical protein TorRG33x02_126190 [Trema orientale]|uniref:Uncharacterized protein n=1 Tax=Trema orientale TaxID=63057 RepID=A0A2P5F1B7_TREOI|nr:hypothetical protein TorRG33x02_126190 [Trema orientale]
MARKVNPVGTMGPEETQQQPHFRPKRGSVFPAERRSVKRMIFDHILHSLATAFIVSRRRGRPRP